MLRLPYLLPLCWFLALPLTQAQYWRVIEQSPMPEAVANNAVVAAEHDGVSYVYSFAGIDTSKAEAGIHLRSYRYNTQTDTWESLPPLPDTLGKIAAAASVVGDVIYIMGGYHVLPDGEISSDKVHRFSISANDYLSDGAPIPVPIDDQVQAVWRDSLIYLVTGWNGDIGRGANVSSVQVYNPTEDSWASGTSVPENDLYKAFGASGVIIGDTIFYYGGASNSGFRITGLLRKGLINPNNPEQIGWLAINGDPVHMGYRMGATVVEGKPYWLGGSGNTYNFDGIAYDGSGGVSPANRSIFFDLDDQSWNVDLNNELPMDLRGVGEISDTVKYLVGGMEADQRVTGRTLRLERSRQPVVSSLHEPSAVAQPFQLQPNPSRDWVNLRGMAIEQNGRLRVWNAVGELVLERGGRSDRDPGFSVAEWPAGTYWVQWADSVQPLVVLPH
ncbi:MAG: hypothetical protein AAFW73_14155 [Bacteroidota bacterium]